MTEMERIVNVLVLEDQQSVRDAFTTMLDMQDNINVVATAATVREAVNLAWVHQPEVALIDVQLPDGDGFTVVDQLRTAVSHCRCIILTAFDMPGYLSRAYDLGAWAFICKTMPFADIISTIRQVAGGRRLLNPRAVSDDNYSVLTPRETEILQVATHVCTTAEIASELHLSQGTVNNYISSILAKLGAGNRAQAIQIAQKNGWL